MRDEMRGWFRRAWASCREKKLRWLMLLGVIGMVAIALSELIPQKKSVVKESTVTVSAAAVEQALEDRIAALVGQVAGVGRCRVMVTLENGSRYVYAAEQSYSATDETYTGADKTLFVQTDTGPIGLLVTEIQPTVKGVAVVCDGGDNESVREQVSQLVCAAFNISSGRVYVAKQQS